MTVVDIFDSIYRDIWRIILSYLCIDDIKRFRQVCSKVKTLSSTGALFYWENRFKFCYFDILMRKQGLCIKHFDCGFFRYPMTKPKNTYLRFLSSLPKDEEKRWHVRLNEAVFTKTFGKPFKYLKFYKDGIFIEGIHGHPWDKPFIISRHENGLWNHIVYEDDILVVHHTSLNKTYRSFIEKVTGMVTVFYPDKNLKSVSHYINGKKTGECKEYYRNKNIKSISQYKDGNLIESLGYYDSGEKWKILRSLGHSSMYYKTGEIWVKWLRWKYGEPLPKEVVGELPPMSHAGIDLKKCLDDKIYCLIDRYTLRGYSLSYTLRLEDAHSIKP